MLVTFAIDGEALKIAPGMEARGNANHYRLLNLWRRVGVLMVDSDVLRAVEGLPQSLRKAWKAALGVNRRDKLPGNWRGFASVQSGIDLYVLNNILDLACFEDVKADCLGVPEARISCNLEGVSFEICRLGGVDQTNAFQGAMYLAEQGINKESPTEEVWKKRFSRLASFSRQVTVVDRYAVKELCEASDKCQCGLWGFLDLLGREGCKCSAAVYAARSQTMPDQVIASSTQALFKGISIGGIRDIAIHLMDEYKFKNRIHDRWVRFDDMVCEIGIGVSLFKKHAAPRDTTFTAKPRTAFTRGCESFLREFSRIYSKSTW